MSGGRWALRSVNMLSAQCWPWVSSPRVRSPDRQPKSRNAAEDFIDRSQINVRTRTYCVHSTGRHPAPRESYDSVARQKHSFHPWLVDGRRRTRTEGPSRAQPSPNHHAMLLTSSRPHSPGFGCWKQGQADSKQVRCRWLHVTHMI